MSSWHDTIASKSASPEGTLDAEFIHLTRKRCSTTLPLATFDQNNDRIQVNSVIRRLVIDIRCYLRDIDDKMNLNSPPP